MAKKSLCKIEILDNRDCKRRARKGEPESYIQNDVLGYEGDECLIWPYARHVRGYALARIGKKLRWVSRYVCEVVNGPPPTPELCAAHSCGNGHLGCVNPRHLRWATQKENMEDKIGHDTHMRGERCHLSKLTARDVFEIRSLKGKFSQTAIASRFGISQPNVSKILRDEIWNINLRTAEAIRCAQMS